MVHALGCALSDSGMKLQLVEKRNIAAFIDAPLTDKLELVDLEHSPAGEIGVGHYSPNYTQPGLRAGPRQRECDRLAANASTRCRCCEPIADHRASGMLTYAFNSEHADEVVFTIRDRKLNARSSFGVGERVFYPASGRLNVVVVTIPGHPSAQLVRRCVDGRSDGWSVGKGNGTKTNHMPNAAPR